MSQSERSLLIVFCLSSLVNPFQTYQEFGWVCVAPDLGSNWDLHRRSSVNQVLWERSRSSPGQKLRLVGKLRNETMWLKVNAFA